MEKADKGGTRREQGEMSVSFGAALQPGSGFAKES